MKLESAIQSQILAYLKSLECSFFFKAIMCNISGVPDICGVYKGKSIWIEVKSVEGKLSPQQVRVGSRIKSAGGEWIIARSVEDVKSLLQRIDNE